MNILLASDGSSHASAAASLIAGLFSPINAQVRVLGVVPQHWSLVGIGLQTRDELRDTVDRLRRVNHAAARVVAMRAAGALQAAGLSAEVTVREGAPAQVILAVASEISADLVALGARGYSPGGQLGPGATARRLARNAKCSVLMARPRRAEGPPRILLAVDRLTSAAAVRQWLRALSPAGCASAPEVLVAGLTGWPTHLPATDADLLAREPDDEQVELRALEIAEEIQDLGFQVRSVFPAGAPRAELVRLASASMSDLVIVGPEGGAPHLGELAWAAVKYAPCSVLVARTAESPGFVRLDQSIISGHAAQLVRAHAE